MILTDVPRIWLDLRAALQGMFSHIAFCLVFNDQRLNDLRFSNLADYDTTAAKHGRLFLWTTWHYYLPVQVLFSRLLKARLENIAGPFTLVNTTSIPDVGLGNA